MKNRPKSLISINDFTKDEILKVLELTAKFEENPDQNLLEGKVVGSIFFEPSTRTRLSFETAVNRLKGRVIGFSEASNTSVSKGETLKDTTMMLANYCDLIVMRHPLEGSVRYASEVSKVPVINAGDGSNQHPTQTMLDLYSIKKTQGTLNNLKIAMVGDLKYGRTVHSLLMAMSHFNTSFKFIAPPELQMPDEYCMYLKNKGLNFEEHTDFAENIKGVDIIYMTRVQRERFSEPMEYEKVKNVYILRNTMLNNTKPNVKILHPLPRVSEISTDVDNNPKAYYFDQALNGVYTRMAVICYILGIK
ncbi:MAG: aspartate carbamoyltransferase [Prevotellaceae bacterium]|jgi:aspartate carbamoyltransferase catalytic subunit|nr:aspartate carbamoyltransferase [Prevotellaceae bacterium]